MPLLLRKVTRPKWQAESPDPKRCNVQADVLDDLRSKRNRLSFWRITEDKNNLNDVLAAMAANCQQLSQIDYALVPEDQVNELGICIDSEADGDTPFTEANKYHVDLHKLTAKDISALAELIKTNENYGRLTKPKVKSLLSEKTKDGSIDKKSLTDSIASKLA